MTKIKDTSDFLTRGNDKRLAALDALNSIKKTYIDTVKSTHNIQGFESDIDIFLTNVQKIRAALTQPDVNAELLGALKLPQTMEVSESQYRYNEAFNHGINSCIKAISRAEKGGV